MVKVKIYIEGGGEGKDLLIRFQKAWNKFFTAAGLADRMPSVIRGKGRKNTYDLFVTAFNNRKPNELPLLLVDSEEPYISSTVWQHLKARDNWDKPNNAKDEDAYLMAQVMETWLLADKKALSDYFGSKFKTNKIPAWTDLEAVSKQSIFDALAKATADCGEKQYDKGKISFELLGQTSPEKVKQYCPQGKRLLEFLAENK